VHTLIKKHVEYAGWSLKKILKNKALTDSLVVP